MGLLSTFGAASGRAFGLTRVGAAIKDAYFNLTTLLLPGNGTNGAQNNTFLDSSTNNFTITRNGNTTQGTFSPFSQTGWSNYFNGSGSGPYLRFGSSSELTFGTGDFTIEFWVYFLSINDGTISYLYDLRNANGTGSFFVEEPANTWTYRDGAGNLVTTGMTSSTFTANQWYHVAVCRASGVINFYVNGTKVSSNPTDTSNYATSYLSIMSRHVSDGGNNNTNCYTSNFRVVKGTAVYTANFTPPTTPLTAISGTSLLTCQSNRFIDNSSNALAATVDTGQPPSVQAFSPFAPTAAYSASTVGGSGYFDGTGDYLTWSSGSSIAFGTGDFTVEAWLYPTGTGNYYIADARNASQTNTWAFHFTPSTNNVTWFNGSADWSVTASVIVNQWNHIAYVRSGTTGALYLNGTRVSTQTDSTNYSISPTTSYIATRYSTAQLMLGYTANTRILKGTAQYSGTTYTIPTAPLTAITNTSLLLNYTNAGIVDSTAKNDLETVGNAQISTTQSKFGGSSMYFGVSGTNKFYTTNLIPQRADFTLELWVYPTSFNDYNTIFDSRTSDVDASGFVLGLTSAAKAYFYTNGGFVLTTTTALTLNTWTHIALVRSGSGTPNIKIYINGTVDATTATYTTAFTRTTASIGDDWNTRSNLQYFGYADDIRISNFARYTANFTPPTAAFPVQ